MDALFIALVISVVPVIGCGVEAAWRWCNRECDRVLGDR
jgi:hypothetical protein